jgi:hypothetical protein
VRKKALPKDDGTVLEPERTGGKVIWSIVTISLVVIAAIILIVGLTIRELESEQGLGTGLQDSFSRTSE